MSPRYRYLKIKLIPRKIMRTQQLLCPRKPSIICSVSNFRSNILSLPRSYRDLYIRMRSKIFVIEKGWYFSTTIDRWARTMWIEKTKSVLFFECITFRLFSLSLSFPLAERRGSSHVEEETTKERQRRSSVPVPVAGRSPHPPVWEFNLLPLRDLERGERSTVSPTGFNGPSFREWRACFAVNIIDRSFSGRFFC